MVRQRKQPKACHFCDQPASTAADFGGLTHARAIIEEVALEYALPTAYIYQRTRYADIVRARATAMRRIRRETDLTLDSIGRLFGLHYSTVASHLNER